PPDLQPLLSRHGKVSRQPASRRACRVVVVIADWHHVPRPLFDADLEAAAGRKLTADKLDTLYEQHVADVKAVQAEQRALLLDLAAAGVREVGLEGFTPEDVPHWKDRL